MSRATTSAGPRWPWPADSPLDRARRLLGSYRAALGKADPLACARIDEWALAHGQAWVVPAAWPYADDELITCQQVADLCHVEIRTVYHWHQRGLHYTRTPDGPRVRVADLLHFEQQRRLARRKGV